VITIIHSMNVDDLDLNLLTVFDRVLRERSNTRAAAALSQSQPAVCNALARLRALTRDRLFVRASAGMVPTAYAERIAPAVSQALDAIRSALRRDSDFDAATSDRCFTLYVTDLGEAYFLPRLVARLSATAPGVRFRTLPTPRDHPAAALQAGTVDLAIGNLPDLRSGFYQQRLFRERYVCIVREAHPFVGARITPRKFEQAGHVLAAPSGTGHAAVERFLLEHGGRRAITVEVQHFLAVPAIVAQSDLVGIVPTRIGRQALRDHRVRLLDLPVAIPPFVVKQCWHARAHHDPANRWLRRQFAELFVEGD
jgi:DNA-binding transcriptional LysR family regulator